jgi:trans-aconitate 3-methyltransferase
MATFGKTTFNAARYASFRPTYPRQLFDSVFRYHNEKPGARWDTALDLGCGTGLSSNLLLLFLAHVLYYSPPVTLMILGQATLELTPFKRIIGLDPSANMITQAKKSLQEDQPEVAQSGQFEFVQGDAENLAFLEDGSVDLIVSCKSCPTNPPLWW